MGLIQRELPHINRTISEASSRQTKHVNKPKLPISPSGEKQHRQKIPRGYGIHQLVEDEMQLPILVHGQAVVQMA